MRRDLDAMMAQITALSSVVHNALPQGVQHKNAADAQGLKPRKVENLWSLAGRERALWFYSESLPFLQLV